MSTNIIPATQPAYVERQVVTEEDTLHECYPVLAWEHIPGEDVALAPIVLWDGEPYCIRDLHPAHPDEPRMIERFYVELGTPPGDHGRAQTSKLDLAILERKARVIEKRQESASSPF